MKAKMTLIAATLGIMGMAHAAVTAEEAARLGKDLTPWGAEKAGNKEGTIPAYTGGLPVDLMGKGYDSNKSVVNGRQSQPDPFKDEKPLYRITAKNMDQYADKLSEATKALFKNDPNYYMDIYPTHRVVNYPKHYIEASLKNATRCKTDESGNSLKNCKGGMPFPIPKTGAEAMWNLQAGNYLGPAVDIEGASTYVDRNGTVVMTAVQEATYQYPYQDSRYSLEEFENPEKPYHNLTFRLLINKLGPARIVGEGTLYLFPTDDRNATSWSYQPGNRRVRTSPNVEYDFPIAAAGGAGFFDEANVFQGRKDRFDWKLMGKKEMIMPYSCYKLAWGDKDKVMVAGKPNPAYVRWELHRAWVVEATRKPGARHAYSKRRYYLDEDATGSAMGDNWDDSGKIARGNYASVLWIWDYQSNLQYFWNSDLISGAYYTNTQYGNGIGAGVHFRHPDTGVGGINNTKMLSDSEYTPESLARRSQR